MGIKFSSSYLYHQGFTLTHLMYYLDLATMARLVYLFFESNQAKKVIEQASKTWVKEGESINIESFTR